MRRLACDPLYLELRREVQGLGFFRPAPAAYVARTALILAAYAAAYAALLSTRAWVMVVPAVVVLGVLNTALPYVAHDAGHGAVTRNRTVVAWLGHAGFTVLNGMSWAWWVHSHDNHHDFVNEWREDLAMKYSLVVSDHREAVLAKRGWKRALARVQAFYLAFLFPLYHFAMVVDGWRWVLRHPRACLGDILSYPLFLLLWVVVPLSVLGWKLALLYYLATKLIGSSLIATTFDVHHIGRRVIEPDERLGPLAQILDGTRTMNTWRLFDFYYHGLNFHIEHHLFPNVPCWRYRRMSPVIQRFCDRHGLVYRQWGFWQAQREVFSALHHIGRLPPPEQVTAAAVMPVAKGPRRPT